jgi:glyoxylase-like metal-dependent hydrolase (beta-lactamase superfamily II)
MRTPPPFVHNLEHGIAAIDTGFHRPDFDAAYLVIEAGRAAFIDTGTNHSVPRLLDALAAAGLGTDAVDYVIPTHVHLDHAGGAGLLMQRLPNARLVVHPRGAPHLIDPRVLTRSARGVYGDEEFERSYGEVVGVDAERVLKTHDGMVLGLAGRLLTFIHTPGHAYHHHCIWDERSRGFFTGDTFGLSYREFDSDQGAWLLPTTTPVQFEPDALRASVQRLLAFEPACMYLTHFGRVRQVARLGAQFLAQLEQVVQLGKAVRAAPQRHAAHDLPQRHAALKQGLLQIYLAAAATAGCRQTPAELETLLALDIELNAQGMACWLDRKPRPTGVTR